MKKFLTLTFSLFKDLKIFEITILSLTDKILNNSQLKVRMLY